MSEKDIKIIIFTATLFLIAFFSTEVFAVEDFPASVAGRIIIQVENLGEAWYVNPDALSRSYLGRPRDAYAIMRKQGIGITNKDLKKIPVGIIGIQDQDQDRDGLADTLEKGLGTSPFKKDTDSDGFSDYEEIINSYNPVGSGVLPIDIAFSRKNKGRIFIQVENHGEAWYVNPADGKRYYLGQAQDAFSIMRTLGLGISNENLSKIMAVTPNFLLTDFENKVYAGINSQRENSNLSSLGWNQALANVAREHSQNLADENKKLTGLGTSCDMPFIHHEGLDFGISVSERLHNRQIYYFSKTGENIALMAAAAFGVMVDFGSNLANEIENCQNKKIERDDNYRQDIEKEEDNIKIMARTREEIEWRQQKFSTGKTYEVAEIEWQNIDQMAEKTVQGWVDSPGHLANMLNADYTETGVGAAYVNGYLITTQVFIKRSDCGYQDGACCVEEGFYPYCYGDLNCNGSICR